jgi:hypothetical protein
MKVVFEKHDGLTKFFIIDNEGVISKDVKIKITAQKELTQKEWQKILNAYNAYAFKPHKPH